MRCNEIAPYLEDLLDEELGEATAPVREHLATCPECRRRLEWLAASREAFRSLPPERPRNGFDRRLAERIAVETGAKVLPPRGELWRRPALQWALAASLLIAALGGSLFFKGPLAPIGANLEPAEAVAPSPAKRGRVEPPSPTLPRADARERAPSPLPKAAKLPLVPPSLPQQEDGGQVAEVMEEPAPPPAPEYLEEDRMAGLDAPPTLGYVQAQDLPVSFRCQLDGEQEGCGARTTAQSECGGFGECSGAGYDAAELAADLSGAVTTE